jgi:deoxyribodipyrimidine photo-lyase
MRALFWFRADLRLRDNRGLKEVAARARELRPVFVLDPRLLEGPRAGAPRTRFLLDCVERLARDLELRGCPLVVRRGRPERELAKLVRETGAELVGVNRDYGPFARRRDERVRAALEKAGAKLVSFKDRVVFESHEVRSSRSRPYAVYTPYRNAWRKRWEVQPELPERAPRLPAPIPGVKSHALARRDRRDTTGATDLPTGGEDAARRRLAAFLDGPVSLYAQQRDLPAVDGTSRLSPYLRFGAISARTCVAEALARAEQDPAASNGANKWVDELIWREFYSAILGENPRVTTESYRREFDAIEWERDESGFAAWCAGRTGYPFVDAGMRQLAATGWMHNRARMIAASFLTKDLLIDWRRGERYFFERLVDGDPASNNGGWQWSASTGTDAQPYFRIFNPVAQGERYDPDGAYVRRFVPELAQLPATFVHRPWAAPAPPPGYAKPIVDHAERRALALQRYESARRRFQATGSG